MNTYILLDLEAKTQAEALYRMSHVLEQAGVVKPGHGAAVVARETEFPTGLPTASVQVAIPHASADYTSRSTLLFCRLKDPVPWSSMEEDDAILPVKLVFMLALKEAAEHTAVLCRLMQIFQQPQLLQALCLAADEAELRSILAIDT